MRLGKAARSVARTGPSSEVGVWIAAAMLGYRERGGSRAAAACLHGAALMLDRAAVEEAMAVVARVTEVAMVAAAARVVEEARVVVEAITVRA